MNTNDYKEINEEYIEILGQDGIYRKYSEYKQKKEKKKILYWIPFILALIYILSPIDVVPDRIHIGKLDDIFLLSITLLYAIKKANFVENSIINMIIKNIILSTSITLFVLMIFIYIIAILV